MKSIRLKLEIALIICMTCAFLVMSAICSYNLYRVNQADSDRYVWTLCRERVGQFNDQLAQIEVALDLIARHAHQYIRDSNIDVEKSMKILKESTLASAEHIDAAYSVFFVANTDNHADCDDHSFYYILNTTTGVPVDMLTIIPSLFSDENGLKKMLAETASEGGVRCWLEPYMNKFIPNALNRLVVAYTVPLYDDKDVLYGVIGMEFPLRVIHDEIENFHIYETGYAFLTDTEGVILVHPDYPFGTKMNDVHNMKHSPVSEMMANVASSTLISYEVNGEMRKMAAKQLKNGMVLIISVPEREINHTMFQTMKYCFVGFIIVLIISAVIMFIIVHKYSMQLKRLIDYSQNMINGNIDFEFEHSIKGHDELSQLTNSFKNMARHVTEKMDTYSNLAYKDAMTGVKNKAAYEESVRIIDEKPVEERVFGVIVFDVNNLKKINDNLGHKAGDMLIKRAANIICDSFLHSPVFRIGGDEFTVILERSDYENRDECISNMHQIAKNLNDTLPPEEYVSFAHGLAVFNQETDSRFADVFSRADKAMYENKRKMKQKMKEEQGMSDIDIEPR